ncbi:PLC-like phosphodiesterase [Decorospora gaudefroyi]|uniref:PLC-like phosphodiesterase n=1 Tax=Decorospora gaudefroyi TaxID=184978 RepID=A0A6A5K951_9PLEO|nr:PLC-like phosphodiesterase [Decorospora gaudefroyi]
MILILIFLLPLALLPQCVFAQSPSTSDTSIPSVSVGSVNSTSSSPLSTTSSESAGGIPVETPTSGRQNVTATTSTTSLDVTAIVGLSPSTDTTDGSASTTSAAHPRPTNTRPCNGYVEFCQRKISNISMVVAHNSPFVRLHNAASNQAYPVLNQLNDGIRGLQFETQKPNASSSIRLCHTSCDLLDMGTLESYLATVKTWLDKNPYEVIAIMMGNNNGLSTRIPATDYIAPFHASGIQNYLWTPPSPTLNLPDWPTLSHLILTNKRVITMLDYGAHPPTVPWLLPEFNYQWQTPFSPTDPAFPCTQHRPPNQPDPVSRNRMYMLNHNLNIQLRILPGQAPILLPAYSLLDQVNAVAGNGSLGRSVKECEALWGRPPNWILVDYYNCGSFNGSVFEVAARANRVPFWDRACCGSGLVSGARGWVLRGWLWAVSGMVVGWLLV